MLTARFYLKSTVGWLQRLLGSQVSTQTCVFPRKRKTKTTAMFKNIVLAVLACQQNFAARKKRKMRANSQKPFSVDKSWCLRKNIVAPDHWKAGPFTSLPQCQSPWFGTESSVKLFELILRLRMWDAEMTEIRSHHRTIFKTLFSMIYAY